VTIEYAASLETENGSAITVRGWTGEYLQTRRLADGDYGLWHPDGEYFGRLVPDAEQTCEQVSGTVFGPTGLYLADAAGGRLRVDPRRRRARATAVEQDEDAFASPGNLAPVERRWPRRG
jgi:hypothetical protein